MANINELKNHMQKHKDAVVLIGPDAIKELNLFRSNQEELKEKFNKKVLRRKPIEFWDYFVKNVYINPDENDMTSTQKSILQLFKLGLVSNIIDLNGDGLMLAHEGQVDGLIQLHGDIQTYTCQNPSCKTSYSRQYVFGIEDEIKNTCELCDKPIRPDILLIGENYDDDKYHLLKTLIANTHTLITVGLDYSEEPIINLIADYGDIKELSKQQEDPKMLVGVHKSDLELDVNEVAFHEFLAKDEVSLALSRLLKLLVM